MKQHMISLVINLFIVLNMLINEQKLPDQFVRSRIITCNELAVCGYKFPIHCKTHSVPSDNSLIHSACSACHLPAIIDKNEHCCFCKEIPT